MLSWTHRGIFVIAASLAGGMALLAQKSTPANPGNSPTANPTTNSPTAPVNNNPLPTLNSPNQTNPNTDTFADRPIFLSGRVMFDDGSPANRDIRIERVCGIQAHLEANVDSKGRFSFQLGANNVVDMSASDSSYSSVANPSQRNSQLSGMNPTGRSGSEGLLWGCELRAAYPGYRSEVISLAGRRTLDNPDVGVIILHRIAEVQGSTISLTTSQAPKAAQKNYEKGMQAAQKGKFGEAEEHLLEAVQTYPKYAIAWFALGQVQQSENKSEEAKKSYLAALDADRKYVSPYDRLALMAARDSKWEDAADYSQQAVKLNPVEFPSAFWYNAVANYQLNRPAEAAKSAQALIKLDTQHRYPEANRMLAEILLDQKEFAEAATYLRAYLAEAPKAKDADALKQQLLKIEQASAPSK